MIPIQKSPELETSDQLYDVLYGHIKKGDCTAIEAYLNGDGDPNLHNRNGWTLLMAAAFKGNLRIVTLLLERGAEVNAVTRKSGESALALAAGGGYTKSVKRLLEHGADVSVTPLSRSLAHYLRYAKSPCESVNRLLAGVGVVPPEISV